MSRGKYRGNWGVARAQQQEPNDRSLKWLQRPRLNTIKVYIFPEPRATSDHRSFVQLVVDTDPITLCMALLSRFYMTKLGMVL